MFKQAIVRRPCPQMVNGITAANLGLPDYHKALIQHDHYIQALETCGLKVTVLEADERFPDSTFIEDVAIMTPVCAVITNPGAASRKGEVEGVTGLIKTFREKVAVIQAPGTLEGGDVMMVGSHFYIGISERTNTAGARQLIDILRKYDLDGSMVPLEKVLHLKTGVSYLENNHLLACGEFLQSVSFSGLKMIEVDPAEAYAANSIWVNGTVIMPSGYPRLQKSVRDAGYKTLTVDVSEFRKLDGGVSCLSLRF